MNVLDGLRRDPLPDRPAVLDALHTTAGSRCHAVIEASAGTGKTHALEHLVIDLLREGTPIDRILVVTFTEKATLEMRARIRRRIADLVKAGYGSLRAALIEFDRAPISTIHAFCQRVLGEHAFASGRLLDQQRIDAREAFGRAFRDALRRSLRAGAPEEPLLRSALAVYAPSELEEKLWCWSRERGEIRPAFDLEAIAMALSTMPTEGDPDRTRNRAVGSTLRSDPRDRLHDVLARLAPIARRAREGVPVADLLPELWAWGSDDPSGQSEPNASYLARKLGHDPVLGPHVRALETCRSPLPWLVHRWLPDVLRTVDADKERSGGYDFDDMLRLVRAALEGPRGPEIVRALRDRYRYALVDEFQDTDPIQWAIFRRLFLDPPAGAGPGSSGRALYLIGDPKQAIYGFRGADVHTYHAACAEILARGGVRVQLVDGYRSTEPMIRAVNRILEQGFFTGVNRYEYPVRCARPELRAVDVRGAALVPIQILYLVSRDRLRAKNIRSALSIAIAEEITRLLGGAMRVSDRDREDLALRALRPSDIFVLTRTGSEAQEVAEALRCHGIVHALATYDTIWQTREARDVLDVLRALEDLHSRASRLRAFLTPFFGVSLADLDACRELSDDHPFSLRLVRWSTLAREHRFAELFSAMMDESGLARRLLFFREGERELVNYQHLFESLLRLAGQRRLGLRELCAELAARVGSGATTDGAPDDLQRLESERAAVQVLTMHKSKGLEAEVVFLFGGWSAGKRRSDDPRVYHEDGARVAWIGKPPPEVGRRVEEEEREEDERLLYVAMTRARSRLYLPYIGPPFPGTAVPAGARSECFRLDGSYRVLNERLSAIARAPRADDFHLFDVRVVEVGDASRRAAPSSPLPTFTATPIAPALPVPSLDSGHFERLRQAASAMAVTSYTTMKRAGAPSGEIAVEDPALEEIVAEADRSIGSDEGDEEALPAGAAFGVFVHEILEKIDPAVVLAADSGEALLAHGATRLLFLRSAERNGIEKRFLSASAELVYRALRTPIRAGVLVLPRGLAALSRRVTEMRFLYPIPERAHPLLGAQQGPDRPPLSVERGFVQGVIDLVFEHEGRVWLLDWKTDRLPSYDAASVTAHVEAHYALQARLYALAVARLLRIESPSDHEQKFGGILYGFVRGMRLTAQGTTEGVDVNRPDFATLQRWDREMREDDAPWGYPLPPRPIPFGEARRGAAPEHRR